MSLHRGADQPALCLGEHVQAEGGVYLDELLRGRRLAPVFQPIVDLRGGVLLGYEGLIRGPNGPLHIPTELFRAAAQFGCATELEIVCCHTLLERFAALALPGRLFLNISPKALPSLATNAADMAVLLQEHGLVPGQVVFELTEHPSQNTHLFYELLESYRRAGFGLALDDLGDGHSSLRRWCESRPGYVKIDRYFVQGIHLDAIKQQFLRSICDIANGSGALIIAEGIEQPEELEFLVSLDIRGGQGFYLGRPDPTPAVHLGASLRAELNRHRQAARGGSAVQAVVNAGSLLRTVPHVSPDMSNDGVCDLFDAHPELRSLPVVDRENPIGMIRRDDLIGRFSRPYQRELYGRRSCTLFMDINPPMADQRTTLQQLSYILIEADQSRLINDFIITGEGRYLGIGTSYDLLRELTQAQFMAAKHANRLTGRLCA